MTLPQEAIAPVRVQAFVLRCPIAQPVRTSFGTMHDRPAVFVRVQDQDGATGWGEIWCNFPACGAEHRARLLDTVVGPLLTSRSYTSVPEAFTWLSECTAVLAIQSGEPGPMAQVIAGVDLALWDLSAHRAGQPLWRHLGGTHGSVGVYASGLNPNDAAPVAAARLAEGYRAFKVKIGFDRRRDLANLGEVRAAIGEQSALMVDANQAWALDQAREEAAYLEQRGIDWLEEPLRADRPWEDWRALARSTSLRLAAGENIAGGGAFDAALASKALAVVQPDVAKWGGISGCWPLVARIRATGLRYCPHFLGGGIGLLHSAHLLAASGGDGLLEVDANPNPLRSELTGALAQVHEGRCVLDDTPGIGAELPDKVEDLLRRFGVDAASGTTTRP